MGEPGYEIRLLGPGDETVLERLDSDVFDHALDPASTTEFLNDPRHHLAVAIVDGVVIGMASGIHYVHPDKPPALFVAETGVAEPFRRRGIAKALMAALLEHARGLGCREAWVATEPDNTAAQALYASSGGVREDDLSVVFVYPM